jgi:hypothetical protein
MCGGAILILIGFMYLVFAVSWHDAGDWVSLGLLTEK